MELEDLLEVSVSGKVVESSTNEDYKKLWEEECSPRITQLIRNYADAARDATMLFIK